MTREEMEELKKLARELDANAWWIYPKMMPYGHGDRTGNPTVWYDVDREKGGHGSSVWVCLRGRWQGRWHHAARGESGDTLEAFKYFGWASSFGEALDRGRAMLGLPEAKRAPPEVEVPIADDDGEGPAEPNGKAFSYFLEAQASLKGTPAELYLKRRGIDLAVLGRQPEALRYHPAMWERTTGARHPCLLALATNAEGKPVTVHRIWVTPDGAKLMPKNKKFYSSPRGAICRLWRGRRDAPRWQDIYKDPALAAAETMAISEGVENALAFAIACPEFRVGAAFAKGLIGKVVLPKGLGRAVILMDDDEDEDALRYQALLLSRQCPKIAFARPPRGRGDFNDLLQEGADA